MWQKNERDMNLAFPNSGGDMLLLIVKYARIKRSRIGRWRSVHQHLIITNWNQKKISFDEVVINLDNRLVSEKAKENEGNEWKIFGSMVFVFVFENFVLVYFDRSNEQS